MVRSTFTPIWEGSQETAQAHHSAAMTDRPSWAARIGLSPMRRAALLVALFTVGIGVVGLTTG